MTATDEAHRVLADARASRVFPSAVGEVGDRAGAIWQDALGTRTFDAAESVDLETPYDLASLTKVIVTTTLVMQLVGEDVISLDDRVGAFIPEWRSLDREAVTIRDLLEHASGLPARLVDPPPPSRREFEHDICAIRLECAPRTRSIYSDLGFILLGFIVADRGESPMAAQFEALWADPMLQFELPFDVKRRAAPTEPLPEDPRRGRLLAGEVHDNYASALGGVAGHAGVFGTVQAVGAFARTVLRAAHGDVRQLTPFSPPLVGVFTTRGAVTGSSRALGWDTMLPTSSCGTRMTAKAFGHVGFTGTSLWIDPGRDRYFVLLTNRTCGGGTVDDMRAVRRAFHDALGEI